MLEIGPPSLASQIFVVEAPRSAIPSLIKGGLLICHSENPRMFDGLEWERILLNNPDLEGRRRAIREWADFMLREATAIGRCHPALVVEQLDQELLESMIEALPEAPIVIRGSSAKSVLHELRISKWNFGIIYHVACMGHWIDVVSEQLKCLSDSGLDGVYVSIIGTPEERLQFEALAESANIEIFIFSHVRSLALYEVPAIKFLEWWARNNPDRYVLYFHTKGVSAPANSLKHNWRLLMQKCVIEHWRHNATMLARDSDAVGTVWRNTPPISHFPGNFFMARTEFMAGLEDFSTYYRRPRHRSGHNYYRLAPELWLGSSSSVTRIYTWIQSRSAISSSGFWLENFEYLNRLFPELKDLRVGWWSSPHGVALFLKWKLKFDSFLELGDGCRSNFNRLLPGNNRYVDCVNAGADGKTDWEAFLLNNTETFDLVLTKGIGHQTERETLGRLKDSLVLTGGRGAVICEDLNEADKIERGGIPSSPPGSSHIGLAWKQLRQEHPDLGMYVIDSNTGIGVILVGFPQVSSFFDEDDNQPKMEDELNLISPAKAAQLFALLVDG